MPKDVSYKTTSNGNVLSAQELESLEGLELIKDAMSQPVPVHLEIEQRADSTSVKFQGPEDAMSNALAQVNRMSRPRDYSTDGVVKMFAIAASLIGFCWLSWCWIQPEAPTTPTTEQQP